MNNNLTDISIHGSDLRGGVAGSLVPTTKKCSNLNSLYIVNCDFDDASLRELCQRIRGLSCLEKITLWKSRNGGSIGIGGAEAIRSLLKGPSCGLTNLVLSGFQFNDELATAIVTCLIGNTKLEHLGLSGNSIGRSSCESIVNLLQSPSCNITHLNLDDCGINNESATKIVSSLVGNTKLKNLNLSDNNSIGRSGYESIATLLQNSNSNITKFALRWNKLTNQYISLLTQSLIGNTKLEHLDLSHNKLERSGCESIATLLQDPRCCLTHLNLGYCGFKNELTPIIVRSLTGNTKMTKLCLSDNEIGRRGCESIATSLLQDSKSNINNIDLSFCRIDDECAVLLANSLIGNKKLTCLDLAYNSSITKSGWDAFSSILSDRSNQTLCSLARYAKNIPTNLSSLLKLNHAVDMEPLFEVDTKDDERNLKALPSVVDWFVRVRESIHNKEIVNRIDARKLSAIFQFARAMPLQFVPASQFTHPSVVSLIQLRDVRNDDLETKYRELQQRNSELEKQVVAKDAEIASMREAKEKSDDVLKAKEEEIKDLYGRLDSIVNVAKKRKFPWD